MLFQGPPLPSLPPEAKTKHVQLKNNPCWIHAQMLILWCVTCTECHSCSTPCLNNPPGSPCLNAVTPFDRTMSTVFSIPFCVLCIYYKHYNIPAHTLRVHAVMCLVISRLLAPANISVYAQCVCMCLEKTREVISLATGTSTTTTLGTRHMVN